MAALLYKEFYRYMKPKNDVPAIVLGCHKVGLGIIRALGIKGIPVIGAYYNEMDMGYVSKYVIEKFKISDPEKEEKYFVEDLLTISEKYKGAVLFASDDPTLLAVSRNKDLLNKYFIIEAPVYDLLKIIIVKSHTYKLADKIGVLAPKTFYPESFEEARSFARNLGFPNILKPFVGHLFFKQFKKKMIFIKNETDLELAFNKIKAYKIEMMLQEFIPGDDTHGVNYNSFFVDGKPILEFTAEKIRLSPPQIGFPRVIVSKWIEEVIEPGRKMLSALNYTGISCIEFKKHQVTGKYVLMEINGRQNLSAPLAVKCGYNFPYITYRKLTDGSLPEITGDYIKGIYWIDPGKDIVESIRSFKRERFKFADYFRPYLNHSILTIPDVRDLKPLMKRTTDAVTMIPKIILRKITK